TVSTSSGRSFARATAAAIAAAPRLGAGTSLSAPPNVPIAVRTGSAKTTERDVMENLLSVGVTERSRLPLLRGRLIADLATPALEPPGVIERVLLHELDGGAQALDAKAAGHGHLVLRRVGDELGHAGPGAAEAEARRHVQSDEDTHGRCPVSIKAYMHLFGDASPDVKWLASAAQNVSLNGRRSTSCVQAERCWRWMLQ